MLATLVAEPFHRDGWVYEEKVDGWRIAAHKDGSHVRLVSRTGRDHARRFAEITDAIRRLPASSLILDGEVARFDEHLVSRFHLLYEETGESATPPVFVTFDCLWRRGRDLRGVPLGERRQWLVREIADGPLVLP